jgi:RHS repeat-associated protein
VESRAVIRGNRWTAVTHNYQVNVTGGTPRNYGRDNNGNITSSSSPDGSGAPNATYEWDAADRLIAINIGSHRTEIQYDGLGRRAHVTEKEASTVTSEKRYLWCGNELCEERNAAGGTVKKRLFAQGEERIGGSDAGTYFYTRDHLGSVRELVDSVGAIRARYDYDLWGHRNKLAGNLDCDFGFTGFYFHDSSGLNFSLTRAYDNTLGKWLGKDPIQEKGGLNLYGYVANDPLGRKDPSGLWYALIPGTWFDGNGFEGGGSEFFRGSDFDDGGYAALDAMNPFGNPFGDNGYIKNCNGLGFSRGAGRVAGAALALAGFAGVWGALGRATIGIAWDSTAGHAVWGVTQAGETTMMHATAIGSSTIGAEGFALAGPGIYSITGIPVFFPAAALASRVVCWNCVTGALGAVRRGLFGF